MSHIKLEEAKSFLNVYYTEKDAEIQLFIDAAEKDGLEFMNRCDYAGLIDEDSPPADSPGAAALFPNVKVALLMQVNDYWQNREPTVTGTTVAFNPTAQNILYRYRLALGV